MKRLGTLLGGRAIELESRVLLDRSWWLFCLLCIVAGSGAYGFTIGLWRHPLQGLYTALKLPLVMVLTTGANLLINGMLAQAYGSRIPFVTSSLLVITSYALLSVLLGALAPVTLFFLWNTPTGAAREAILAHNALLLMHIALIAFAGVVSNVRLYGALAGLQGSRRMARTTLFSWLAMNLFVGCQVSWNLRPFVGSPELDVVFLRPNAFEGTFYELALDALMNVLHLH